MGEWLPEPLVADSAADPARQAELADSLSLAFLVLLESLSPEQRAALLLRDVFDYDYAQIADIVGKSEDNARQLAARARRHVEEHRPRFEASREHRDELARRFFAAAQEGELERARDAARHDVVLHGDGGGKAPALARARCRAASASRAPCAPGCGRASGFRERRSARSRVNGQPGALILAGEEVLGVMGARHRRRSDPGGQVDREPGQAGPRRPGR